jgi:hypothetical protein
MAVAVGIKVVVVFDVVYVVEAVVAVAVDVFVLIVVFRRSCYYSFVKVVLVVVDLCRCSHIVF